MTTTQERRKGSGHRRGGRLRSTRIAIAGLAGFIVALPAAADWFDDFDAGFANAWIFAATDDGGSPPSTGTSTFTIVESGADDYLLIAHTTTALPDGGGGAADGFGYVDETFANLAILADVNAAPERGQQSVLGVLGRGNPATGASYLAAIDFAASRFAIARSDDFVDFQTPLVVDDSVLLDRDTIYHIQFFLVGSSLTARLLDATTRELLSTITVTDPHYASGRAGVIVETAYQAGVPVAPIIGTFDDVEAVPEPGGPGSLAVACATLGYLVRRSQRSRPQSAAKARFIGLDPASDPRFRSPQAR